MDGLAGRSGAGAVTRSVPAGGVSVQMGSSVGALILHTLPEASVPLPAGGGRRRGALRAAAPGARQRRPEEGEEELG